MHSDTSQPRLTRFLSVIVVAMVRRRWRLVIIIVVIPMIVMMIRLRNRLLDRLDDGGAASSRGQHCAGQKNSD